MFLLVRNLALFFGLDKWIRNLFSLIGRSNEDNLGTSANNEAKGSGLVGKNS